MTVLHHDRVKKRFGENRRFIRCDRFPASYTHFLSQLSKAIGAGVENPEDLASLRPFLSLRETIIILDNAESILDPQGTGAQEIYEAVEELSQFETICLCITSRVSTVPGHCKRPTIPTLSMESACDIFYGIYDDGDRSEVINDLLSQLDFHALSITLLATTASHNMWGYNRLAREWNTRRVQVLRTDYNRSLAATIELSLASPTFRELGTDARDLLGVIAFFPQGVDEKNLDWLFPTILDRRAIFDKFCVLSLTHRSNGFFTMLAPLRDYLRPTDPMSSPLLRATKKHYFGRLSVDIDRNKPSFRETRWIMSEDVNIEHLLDISTAVDANSDDTWDACYHFMKHLFFHKPRLVVLRLKIEGLPDNHNSKPECLFWLSHLFHSIGNHVQHKQVLIHSLRLRREQRDDPWVARTLRSLSDANRWLGLYEEGIEQAKEALEISKRLNDKSGQAKSWQKLAWLLYDNKQLDVAEETASRALDLSQDEGYQLGVCRCHRLLGEIYSSEYETQKAIHHYETALGIASSFSWPKEQFWNHFNLAQLLLGENRFGNAHAHAQHAKSHAINDSYLLGRAMELQAWVWCGEGKFEDAQSEILRAVDVFERVGAAADVKRCTEFFEGIEEVTDEPATSDEDSDGELLETDHYPLLLTSCSHLSQPSNDSASDNLVPPSSDIPSNLPLRLSSPYRLVTVAFLTIAAILRLPAFCPTISFPALGFTLLLHSPPPHLL